MKLDVAPPGQIATMKMPNFHSGGRSVIETMKNARRGKKINCRANPIDMLLGDWTTFLKSPLVNEADIPNVMRASVRDIRMSIKLLKVWLSCSH